LKFTIYNNSKFEKTTAKVKISYSCLVGFSSSPYWNECLHFCC